MGKSGPSEESPVDKRLTELENRINQLQQDTKPAEKDSDGYTDGGTTKTRHSISYADCRENYTIRSHNFTQLSTSLTLLSASGTLLNFSLFGNNFILGGANESIWGGTLSVCGGESNTGGFINILFGDKNKVTAAAVKAELSSVCTCVKKLEAGVANTLKEALKTELENLLSVLPG